MCISGDVCGLTKEQWDVIDKGMDFYQNISDIIKDGYTYFYGSNIASYRHPKGWQGILRQGNKLENSDRAFLLLHSFNDAAGKEIEIELPAYYSVSDYYSYCSEDISLKDKTLRYTFHDDMQAICIRLNLAKPY